MAYVLEYTRRHYHRKEIVRRVLLVLLALAVIVLGSVAWMIRSGSQCETLRDLLNGAYRVDVDKLESLNEEWNRLKTAHLDLAPYLQLVWSPQHPTNVLGRLIERAPDGQFLGGLKCRSWKMKIDGRTFVSDRVCNPANMSVNLVFRADRINEAGAAAAQQALTNLFEHVQSFHASGLEEMRDDVEVSAAFKLAAFKTLPVSSSLPKAVERIGAFRKQVLELKLGLFGASKDEVSLQSAFAKTGAIGERYKEDFARALDPGPVIRACMNDGGGSAPGTRNYLEFALARWSEIADARLPWRRREARKLLAEGSFISPEIVRSLLDAFPDVALLKASREKLASQSESFTNACLATDFQTLDRSLDNLYGSDLAPEIPAVAKAKRPEFVVEKLYRKSPGWFWMEMPSGVSNLVAFATWSCTIECDPEAGGMAPADLLNVARRIAESDRGYALDGFAFDFDKEQDGGGLRRVVFTGLLPVVYPTTSDKPAK